MDITMPDDMGKKVWVMHHNQPTEVVVIGAGIVVESESGARLVAELNQMAPTKELLLDQLKTASREVN